MRQGKPQCTVVQALQCQHVLALNMAQAVQVITAAAQPQRSTNASGAAGLLRHVTIAHCKLRGPPSVPCTLSRCVTTALVVRIMCCVATRLCQCFPGCCSVLLMLVLLERSLCHGFAVTRSFSSSQQHRQVDSQQAACDSLAFLLQGGHAVRERGNALCKLCRQRDKAAKKAYCNACHSRSRHLERCISSEHLKQPGYHSALGRALQAAELVGFFDSSEWSASRDKSSGVSAFVARFWPPSEPAPQLASDAGAHAQAATGGNARALAPKSEAVAEAAPAQGASAHTAAVARRGFCRCCTHRKEVKGKAYCSLCRVLRNLVQRVVSGPQRFFDGATRDLRLDTCKLNEAMRCADQANVWQRPENQAKFEAADVAAVCEVLFGADWRGAGGPFAEKHQADDAGDADSESDEAAKPDVHGAALAATKAYQPGQLWAGDWVHGRSGRAARHVERYTRAEAAQYAHGYAGAESVTQTAEQDGDGGGAEGGDVSSGAAPGQVAAGTAHASASASGVVEAATALAGEAAPDLMAEGSGTLVAAHVSESAAAVPRAATAAGVAAGNANGIFGPDAAAPHMADGPARPAPGSEAEALPAPAVQQAAHQPRTEIAVSDKQQERHHAAAANASDMAAQGGTAWQGMGTRASPICLDCD